MCNVMCGDQHWLGSDSLQYGRTNLWKPSILNIGPVLFSVLFAVSGGVIAMILARRKELRTLERSEPSNITCDAFGIPSYAAA